MANTVYIITRKPKGQRVTQPLCYQDSRKDADTYVRMLREQNGALFTYAIRPVRKGVIEVKLNG